MPSVSPQGGGQSPHAAENSLDRARIWFLAACSLSSFDRRSGGPSIPTVTRPESSPRVDVNVNRYEPGPSSTTAIRFCMLKSFPALGECHFRAAWKENPANKLARSSPHQLLPASLPGFSLGGASAALGSAKLQRLLPWVATLPALLRPALVVLAHINQQNCRNT
jgi:hypothetical protein